MKLYTEEQVKMLDINCGNSTLDEVIGCLTPIELPSKEEMEIEALSFCNSQEISSDTSYYGFLGACQWFLRKIQGGNK